MPPVLLWTMGKGPPLPPGLLAGSCGSMACVLHSGSGGGWMLALALALAVLAVSHAHCPLAGPRCSLLAPAACLPSSLASQLQITHTATAPFIHQQSEPQHRPVQVHTADHRSSVRPPVALHYVSTRNLHLFHLPTAHNTPRTHRQLEYFDSTRCRPSRLSARRRLPPPLRTSPRDEASFD